jgi:hypothetical protein
LKPSTAAVAAALFMLAASPVRAANPSLSADFRSMTQWLSHEMANGLAFNAGSTFDPPREVTGWALQPDLSVGVGHIPFNKSDFPTLTVPALQEQGGSNIFPNGTNFPNLALHLRMGLPWRGDAYLRFADATTPPGYKISPTMTAQVQTNSFGFGIRQHFDLWEEDLPKVTLGAHYNHVQGRTRLKGLFNVNIDNNFKADSELKGEIDWSLNSFALTAVAHKNFDSWTPFFGFGYNYATGSVRSKLELKSRTFLIADVMGESSDRPEQSQGRWITGVQYERPKWSAFFNAELKALGRLQYRSWVAQLGIALPFKIGTGPKTTPAKRVASEPIYNDVKKPAAAPKARRPLDPKKPEQAHPDMIFLQ